MLEREAVNSMTKVGNTTLNELTARSPCDVSYTEYMAEELKKSRPASKPLPDLSHMTDAEKQEFYFQQQPEATKAAILRQKNRDPAEDLDYIFRPMPDCIANPNALTKEELVGERNIDPNQYASYKSMQRASKNTLGESTKSSVSWQKAERAVHAFEFSQPATLSERDYASIKKLEQLKHVNRVESVPLKQNETAAEETYWLSKSIDKFMRRILFWNN